MDNQVFITAGLSASKGERQIPETGKTFAYKTVGLSASRLSDRSKWLSQGRLRRKGRRVRSQLDTGV